ncbi:MAG: hypothetical protein JWM68_4086 [Verrucomicrobiales bacterium]|nr:hypothetical protein [Verrucomicrobiales bacterium]
MRYFSANRYQLIFLALLVLCSVMVVRQFEARKEQHVKMRESFLLLYTRGYKPQAENLYHKLINDAYKLSIEQLQNDSSRLLLLVDPGSTESNSSNLIWNYYWTVNKELEKRDETILKQALRLADEVK